MDDQRPVTTYQLVGFFMLFIFFVSSVAAVCCYFIEVSVNGVPLDRAFAFVALSHLIVYLVMRVTGFLRDDHEHEN